MVSISAKGGPVTLVHESGGSTAVNRIATASGANVTVPDEATVFLVWNANDSRWHVAGGGDPPFTIGSGSAPATGLLARLAASVGASGVVDPILTWVRTSIAGTSNLITVRDVSDEFAEVVYQGATTGAAGATNYTTFKGYIARLIGTVQVAINGSSDGAGSATSSSEGPGGVLVQGNWMLGASPSGADLPAGGWGSAKCAGWIGKSNATDIPDTNPNGGTWVWGDAYGVGFTGSGGSDGALDRFYFGAGNSGQGTGYVQSLTAYGGGAGDAPSQKLAILNYGAARSLFSWRSKLSVSVTFWNEVLTAASGAVGTLFRFDMIQPDSTVAITFKVTMIRTAGATKTATYTGEAQYYRNASAAPALVNGDAPTYSGHETTAGDGVAFNVSTNEIQVVPTSADTDQRRWFIEIHIHEMRTG